MLFDIVILPPLGVRRQLGRLVTTACRPYSTVYVVDNTKLIPHVSLFHLNTELRRLPALVVAVQAVLKELFPAKVNLISRGCIAWGDGPTLWFRRNDRLVALNRQIVSVSAPIRTGLMPWLPKRKPTVAERSARRRYGVHYNIGARFRPHVTLAKLVHEHDARLVASSLGKHHMSFPLREIAICQVNRGHQVTRILKRFRV